MNKLCKGTLLLGGEAYEIQAEASRNLLRILQEQIPGLSAPCGGSGRCGKCVVKVLQGDFPVTSGDEACLREEQLAQGLRLACMAVVNGDFQLEWCGAAEDGFEALTETAEAQQPTENDLPKVLAIDIGTTTLAFCVYEKTSGKPVCHETGLNHQRAFGGDVIARIQASNEGERQRLQEIIREDLRHGLAALEEKMGLHNSDSFPAEKDGLHNSVSPLEEKEGLHNSNPPSRAKGGLHNIEQVVIAGNTTMIHLLMGYSCETLGVVPFTPYSLERVESDVKSICGYDLDCPVTVLPGISAFVGGDIVAGIMALELRKKEKPCLFLDLGTNGEMALASKERLLVTSTAAGPAFEGGNISCGIGSIPGAICNVSIEAGEAGNAQQLQAETIGAAQGQAEAIGTAQEQTETIGAAQGQAVSITTIENRPPVGICGTGVVETAAELLAAGELDETGLLEEDYFDDGYVLATDPKGEPITFTQQDIREIQLAKAAIRAGLETLLVTWGISYEDVGSVYVAGGFGYKLNLSKAAAIGMLPEELLDKTEAVGNTSLKGAAGLALGQYTTEEIEEAMDCAEEVSLANDKHFQEFYMEYMMFECS